MFPPERGRESGPATRLVAWTATVGVLASLAIPAIPFVQLAYRAPGLHIALETANGLIAGLVAYLLYGRFRETRRARELLLLLSFATIAVANLALTALPSALAVGRGTASAGWAGLAVRLVGTLLLGAAALTPAGRRVAEGRARTVAVPVVAAVVVAWLVGWQSSGPSLPEGDLAHPSLTGHPVVLASHLVSLLVYATAAWRFARRSGAAEDIVIRWLAAGCVLGAFSSAHYAVFPSLYSDYVYSGDVLRLGLYLCLLVGAAKEIRSFFELRTRMAVLAARRRVARDLHDGLAQELSFLWSQSQALVASGQGGDDERIERIAGAAGRALDEARRAIASLTRPLDEPFPRLLQQTVEDLASRYGVTVIPHIDPAATVDLDRGEALLRITAEAMRNAVRHGAASRIDVVLTATPLRLIVRDDGRGFSPGRGGAVRAGSFGLTSMRERAEGMGAGLIVTSAPGEGTSVEVTWP